MHKPLAFILAGCLAAAVLRPAPAPAQETPDEVRRAAASALATGAFVDAVVHLSQLIEWYKDEPGGEMGIEAELEDWYFNLGLCHLLLAQFEPCRQTYGEYLKRFRRSARAEQVAAYVADAYRYEGKTKEALREYTRALRTYSYGPDMQTDLLIGMARCHLAEERWDEAVPLLLQVYHIAPDARRRNWAATRLTTAYLARRRLDLVYRLVPALLMPDSFASYSVALNMAALEVGDELFADEKFRDALWVFRLVYPHDVLMLNCLTKQEEFERRVARLRRTPGRIRSLLRAQELLGDVEAEVEALEKIPHYDPELFYRMARSYLETQRYRESGRLFYDLYLDGPAERQEECLYLSFVSASKVRPAEPALERGDEYMEQYPGGAYYDPVSLTLGQLHAGRKAWPEVIRVLTEAITVRPNHEDIVECLFLLGYAHFMEEHFAETVTLLVRMNTDYPGNDREPDGTYWTGMALLFDKDYEQAVGYFDRVVEDFSGCPYVEDASFRSATCDFGMSRFYESETKLLRFVARYPESVLLGEAYVMLGDISGALGALEEAVRRYQEALAHQDLLDIELYNHAAFRCGEQLDELDRFADLVSHFLRYVERNREGSNLPMAIYWIGHGHWEQGEQERAFATYRRAVEEYGKDPRALGVDLILEEFVNRTRKAEKAVAASAWKGMRDLLKQAIETDERTLALRVERVLIFDPAASDREKGLLRDAIVQERSIEHASPGVLAFVLDEARKDGDMELALAAARRTVEAFTETDYALAARMLLADDAAGRKDYDEAIRHLDIIREVFASSGEAAEALLKLGEIRLERRDFEQADTAYTEVLGVKAWKVLWPAALYGRGEVARVQRRFEQASAYFERIYLLYGGYRAWAAKAYLARAECLARLYEYQKAIETLDEMLGREDLGDRPERQAALDLLEKLKRRT